MDKVKKDRLVHLRDERSYNSLSSAERRELSELNNDAVDEHERRTRNGNVPETRGVRASSATDADKAFTRYLRTGDASGVEIRTTSDGLNTGSTADGGSMVPTGFWQNLQIAQKAYGGVANDYKLVETDDGRLMPWATVDPTATLASIIGTELTQLDPAEPYVFGAGTLAAYTYATDPILASVQIVQDSAFDVGEFVTARVAEQIGRAKADKAVNGSGSGEPLGLITALNAKGAVTTSGGFLTLGTATDVKTFGGTVTELVGNVLSPATCLSVVASMDPAYYEGACWYMNSTQAFNQRSVVDDNGRPFLNLGDGWSDGAIGSIFGFPVKIDNNLPDLTASTTGGPVFMNGQAAMVERRVNGASIMMLKERYADYLAVAWIGYQRSDYRSNDLRGAVTVKPSTT